MHELSRELSGDARPSMVDVMRNVAKRFDGAYSLVLLNACGEMLVARDPLGIKPLCYAVDGPLFAAASESVALANLGFGRDQIKSLKPGMAIVVSDGQLHFETVRRTPQLGPLLLRMDLFCQCCQHAR